VINSYYELILVRNTNHVNMDGEMKKSSSTPRATTSAEELADALVPIAFITMAILNRIGAENDLSLSLIRVMGILRDHRPRMTELAEHLGLEKQTMSGLIARAEKRGMLARVPDKEDRRATEVCLTKEGAKLLEQLRAQVLEAMAPLTDQLSIPEQQRLRELLQRMVQTPRS
jgi:DNA-binding MarR family transcriptional regulator